VSRPVLALLAALALACDGPSVPECLDHGDCGEREACIADRCQKVACIDNSHCQLQQYCDPTGDAYTCVDGCTQDDDCPSGEACEAESHSCQPAGCRSTVLDCAYGELCDPASGTCAADERAHCQLCDAMAAGICPGDGECAVDVDDDELCQRDEDCAPEQSCDELDGGRYCHTDRCRYLCDPDDPDACPRGWACLANLAQPEVFTCVADCRWLEQQGLVGDQSR
jgi:hypothetical protein